MSNSIILPITDDDAVEFIDEFMNVRLFLPGVIPTFGGDYWSVVTIEDDGDGGVGLRSYYDKFAASSVESRARFGYSVDVYGSTMVSGSPYEEVGSVADAGSVSVYTQNNGVWSFQSRILPLDMNAGAFFGSSISLNGNYLAVGAYGTPAVYIFFFTGTVWTQQAKLVAPGNCSCFLRF